MTQNQMIERFAKIDFAASADPITDDFIRTSLRIRTWLEKDFVKRTLLRADELYGGQQTPFKGINKLQDYARLLASYCDPIQKFVLESVFQFQQISFSDEETIR